METIIALNGKWDSGKSTVIMKVFELLKAMYPNAPIRELKTTPDNEGRTVDIRAIMEIEGKILGIESNGDPGGDLPGSLELFVVAKCTIILCATRAWGMTKDSVLKLSPRYDIQCIRKWVEQDTAQHGAANEACATDIFQRIQLLLNAN